LLLIAAFELYSIICRSVFCFIAKKHNYIVIRSADVTFCFAYQIGNFVEKLQACFFVIFRIYRTEK